MTQIPPDDQAFLLLLLVACLGSCLVRAVWELEQMRTRRIAALARRRRSARPD